MPKKEQVLFAGKNRLFSLKPIYVPLPDFPTPCSFYTKKIWSDVILASVHVISQNDITKDPKIWKIVKIVPR